MYIKRRLEKEIQKTMDLNLIAIVAGPRQSGKSSLLKHLSDKFQKNGDEVILIDGDYPDQWHLLLDTEYIVNRAKTISKQDRQLYVFVDELQGIEYGGIALKRVYDRLRNSVKFIGTGSVFLWGRHGIGENLTGRAAELQLLPLSLSEIVEGEITEIPVEDVFTFWKAYKYEIDKIWQKMLKYGAYPEIYLEPDTDNKSKLLSHLTYGFLRRDILTLVRNGDWNLFKSILETLASESSLISISALASEFGRNRRTIQTYFDLAEELFILMILRNYHKNRRTELRKSPRPLFVDIGLLLNIASEHPPQTGLIFEQAVGAEIWKAESNPAECSIRFWRTKSGAEVDFIIGENIPVEVKSGYRGGRISRGFRSFIDTYKPPVAFWLQPGEPQTVMHNETRIQLLPAPLFVLMLQQNQIPELPRVDF